jgi:MSHA biogenesis protein MshO
MTDRLITSRNGFTLIELVVALSISAILVSFMAMFITTPVQAYFAQSRRAVLADSADVASRMMSRDVRTALPNSVRPISNGSIVGIELLATTDRVNYRDALTANDPNGVDFNAPDQKFSTMSKFLSRASTTAYLSIDNAGTPGRDAYEKAHVITPAATTFTPTTDPTNPDEDDVTLSSAVTFNFQSPTHHLFLVSGPVTYLCDTTAKTLTRFSGYPIASSPLNTAAALNAAGATGALIAYNVSSCQIDIVAPVTALYGQLVILRLLLSNSGDNLQVMREMPADGVP